MPKTSHTIGLGELVLLAHAEAERLLQDPDIASLVAAWVVRRILATDDNRQTALALAALS